MFEYALLERARADRQHVVLPEGGDDRILRAASHAAAARRRGPHDPRRRAGDPRPRHRAGPRPRRRRDHRPARRRAARAVRRRVHRDAQAQGHDGRPGAGDRLVGVLLRHDDGPARAGRRHGLRRRAHHGAHHQAVVRDHQDQPGRLAACRACSSCAWRTACSSTATAPSIPDPTAEQLADIAISSAATAPAVRRRAAHRDALLLHGRVRARARTSRRCAPPRRWSASAGPTCPSRARSSTTPPSTPPSPRRRCPTRPSPGARRCSSSPT